VALNAVRFGFCVPRHHFKRAYKSSHYFLLNPLRNRKTSIKMGELVLDSDNEDVPLSILLKDRRSVMIKDEYEEDEDSFASIKKENYSVKTEVKIEEEKKDTRASKKRSRTTKVKNEGEKSTKKRKTSKRKNAKGVKKEKKVTVKKERKPKRKPKTEAEKRKERELKLKKEEEEAHIYKWWENQDDLDGEIKWHTLEHHGVIFPDEYKPLPKSVKLLYDGKPVSLPPEAEEVAGFYGAMLETEHAKNPVFQKNFFRDFKAVLKESGGCPEAKITKFEKCDFSHIYKYFDKQREKKRSLPPQEKKRIREKRAKAEEKYKFCMLDGRKEQVGNFKIEPPGLFRGRGAHPKTGMLKRRVYPEQVTLNLGNEAEVPLPPKGHNWKEVRHDNTVSWLAMWRENISNSFKYVRFANNSSLKGISDFKKFEKARALKNVIDDIRKDYRRKLKSKLMIERQIATATYFIDVLALRAGGEKSEDEADTVGCCSLRYEHIFLRPPNTVIFDFLGKDSVRFYQEVEVDPQVFKNLRIFKKTPKKPGDDLFDRLDPSILNKYFHSYLPGLTAKVFRTYNASKTMQDQLDLIPNKGTVNEKVVRFNAANREVAILCNHQRNVSKGFEASVQKMNEKIEEMQWRKFRLKRMMLQLDKNLKRKKGKAYFDEIETLSKEKEQQIINSLLEKEKERNEKRYTREKQKLDWDKKTISQKEYHERLESLKEDKKKRAEKHREKSKQLKAETRNHKYDLSASVTVEKLEKQVDKLEERIRNAHLQLKDREDNSSVALSTSKVNYIDPRLTVMFSKKYDVPIEKLFTKSLRQKFAWAIESADKDWRF